jgi:hypothetical protein
VRREKLLGYTVLLSRSRDDSSLFLKGTDGAFGNTIAKINANYLPFISI